MAVYENSRYLHTQLMTRLGWDSRTFQLREMFSFNQDNCQLYDLCDGDTLDGISYKFYDNTALRWAILDANPKYRTEFDIKNGDVILIPDYDEVVNIVNVG